MCQNQNISNFKNRLSLEDAECLFQKAAAENQNSVKTEKSAEEDGLLIPEQEQNEEAAQQITVSIDRSYSAVPTEDLQLKGAVVDGKAQITLPEFDKTDFFTHVAGYTWGFSSDPDAKKIEYYGGQTYQFTKDIKLYRVLTKYGGGSGTKDDPYLIDYYDQLELMGKEKARGYFRQTADIVFPEWASHTPINTVNRLKSDPETECFEYDGGGYSISGMNDAVRQRGRTFEKIRAVWLYRQDRKIYFSQTQKVWSVHPTEISGRTLQ